ncbi:hypothetical protein MKW94_013206, partial [Papaver nudicaule]|nr:hypothetical protein [Papaver nudicaule]
MANSSIISLSKSTKFIWTIENFSSLNDEEHHSSSYFVADDCTWCILIYPKELDGKLGMYLMHSGMKSPYAEFSSTVFNQKNQKKTVTLGTHFLRFRLHCWKMHVRWLPKLGFSNMMPLSDLHDPDKGFLVDDTCILQVEISIGWPDDSDIT